MYTTLCGSLGVTAVVLEGYELQASRERERSIAGYELQASREHRAVSRASRRGPPRH